MLAYDVSEIPALIDGEKCAVHRGLNKPSLCENELLAEANMPADMHILLAIMPTSRGWKLICLTMKDSQVCRKSAGTIIVIGMAHPRNHLWFTAVLPGFAVIHVFLLCCSMRLGPRTGVMQVLTPKT